MAVFTNLLSLLGNNNLVPGIIPSTALVLAILFVFDPVLKTSSLLRQQLGTDTLVITSLLVVIPIVILSYTLMAVNAYLIRLCSRYPFFVRFPFMRRLQTRKAHWMTEKLEMLRGEIQHWEKKKRRSEEEELSLDHLRMEYYSLGAAYEQLYPPAMAGVAQSDFGNILKASEAYAGTRYGLDGVAFWPLLVAVIPPEYKKTIDSARNELAFIVNMSLMSLLLYGFCLLAIVLGLIMYYPANPAGILATLDSVTRYVIAGVVALLLNYFFNRAAIYSVESYAVITRSAFDLFRLDLLDQFRLKQPRNSIEEFSVWKNLGELIVLGQRSLEFKPLRYTTKKPQK